MSADIEESNPSVEYYDSDYPSPATCLLAENFEQKRAYRGFDIPRYQGIAQQTGGPVLDLCCGTGRVGIPLACAGHSVVGVDVSAGMLRQFQAHLERQPANVRERVRLVEADITKLDRVLERDFSLVIIAFSSLTSIADFRAQRAALKAAAGGLTRGGVLALDIVNPLRLKLDGDTTPTPTTARRNPHTGNLYTRFTIMDAIDAEHCQRIHGWYEEIRSDGTVRKSFYSTRWRLIFRFEMELMLEEAGLEITSLEGGHRREAYIPKSRRMFILAKKQ